MERGWRAAGAQANKDAAERKRGRAGLAQRDAGQAQGERERREALRRRRQMSRTVLLGFLIFPLWLWGFSWIRSKDTTAKVTADTRTAYTHRRLRVIACDEKREMDQFLGRPNQACPRSPLPSILPALDPARPRPAGSCISTGTALASARRSAVDGC